MADRKPPTISKDTPIGPDVDLDHEDVRLPGGVRLTKTMAARIAEEVHQATRKPTGRKPTRRERELLPLRELLAEMARQLVRDADELQIWERVVRLLHRVKVMAGSRTDVH